MRSSLPSSRTRMYSEFWGCGVGVCIKGFCPCLLLPNIMKLSSPAFFKEKNHNHKLKSGSAAAATMQGGMDCGAGKGNGTYSKIMN